MNEWMNGASLWFHSEKDGTFIPFDNCHFTLIKESQRSQWQMVHSNCEMTSKEPNDANHQCRFFVSDEDFRRSEHIIRWVRLQHSLTHSIWFVSNSAVSNGEIIAIWEVPQCNHFANASWLSSNAVSWLLSFPLVSLSTQAEAIAMDRLLLSLIPLLGWWSISEAILKTSRECCIRRIHSFWIVSERSFCSSRWEFFHNFLKSPSGFVRKEFHR
jgi:hypothetical protein